MYNLSAGIFAPRKGGVLFVGFLPVLVQSKANLVLCNVTQVAGK